MKALVPYLSGVALLALPFLSQSAEDASGEALFEQYCAACHLNEAMEEVPDFAAIAELGTNAVLSSLNTGVMRLQARPLSLAQRQELAEYVGGSPLVEVALPTTGLCSQPLSLQLDADEPRWLGWGGDVRNQRYRPDETDINADNVADLTLQWAFGIPNVTQSRAQPAVIDGVLYMASQTGAVFALDAKSGCTFWSFQAAAGVRSAISVGEVDAGQGAQPTIFFTDATATAYAVDAISGEVRWTLRVDDHHAAAATGSPTYHDGVLYVPVSGVAEENVASDQNYECCTFRGSVSAIDVNSATVLWKHYTVDPPEPRGINDQGLQLYGPAGVAVWTAPTVDVERERLYIATGNAYAGTDVPTGDAIIALDMKTGEREWVFQATQDIWIMGCDATSPGGGPNAGDNPNCPDELGPDYDFSASPILTTLDDGSELIVVPQKSGMGWALDPEDGALVWEYRWGAGSGAGGVWGAAIDEERAYFAVADMLAEPGGMKAVSLADGEERWRQPAQPLLCEPGPGCNAAQSAALTTVPGLVISGAYDGGVRIYDSADGELLWEYSTSRSFDTVNGVVARGGSIDGPGAIVVDGMLYVTSGNAGFFGHGGNVLLAFSVDDPDD